MTWITFIYLLLTGVNGPNTITVTEMRTDAQVYQTTTDATIETNYIFE